jgi:single-strand DNA-binding protein
MANFNKVILVGNLTRDPELRYTPQGAAVCEVGIAVNERWKDKQTGQDREEVSFVDCVLWAKTAEVAAQYLKKGRPVLFEGRLKQDRWESPEGKKLSKIRVVVETMQFLGSKPEGSGAPAGQYQAQDNGAGGDPDADVPF